ncbi:MAG: CPBP family intramembrane metalloprotease [Leptolyngbyaceae cyanobacterium MO_188.B28]|nr:CPBP family intramembrane metalloprotease [Leptolyngbyaceae cyanobacterium MO_188.B28]
MKIQWSDLARWGAALRIVCFFSLLLLLWLPIALLYWLISGQSPNIACLIALYLEFFVLSWVWGRRLHGLSYPFYHYGLVWAPELGVDLVKAMVFGLGGVISLYLIQTSLGWISLQPPASDFPIILLQGLGVALVVGLAEEFLFRGWLLFELERDYSPELALWISSLLFALAHYLRPIAVIFETWPQFFGLVLLGMALVWAKRSPSAYLDRKASGKLGAPIGLHAGLVWGYYLFTVGQLVRYSPQIPEWLTGIDQNPLAGVLGFALLGVIAAFFQRKSRRSATL